MNDERVKSEGVRAKKELIAAVFARAATNYKHIKYFWPLGRLLVERAAISPGSDVLDIACGRGASLFPAAEAVGPTGRVVGIDISAPMAEQTETEIGRRGLLNAHARQMDAEHLDFPDASFDCVLCGFALAFFPRLERALDEFVRVLKPGGRLAASTWGDDDPRWNWYGEMCKAYGIGVKMMTQNLDTPSEIRAALLQAGFTDIQIITETYDMIYESEEEWWMMRWSISGRATLEQLEPEVLARFKAEAFERMQAIKQPDGFHDLLEAHFAIATKPLPMGS
jgi:ubiquinone/menaquinone biosynthesis C-methylase UbiE